jgi:hypothetical protein
MLSFEILKTLPTHYDCGWDIERLKEFLTNSSIALRFVTGSEPLVTDFSSLVRECYHGNLTHDSTIAKSFNRVVTNLVFSMRFNISVVTCTIQDEIYIRREETASSSRRKRKKLVGR